MVVRNFIFLISLVYSFNGVAQQNFEFVVLPDTQTYIEEYPEVYMKQMEWISKQEDRISFVLHVGDITQNNSAKEWKIARKGFSLLDDKIPYNLALGNHDMGSEAGKFADTRNTTLANTFFSLVEYKLQSKSIATFPEGTIDNNCSEYRLAGKDWLVFSLEFGPRNKTLDWVNKIIKEHPNHYVIVNTHSYLYDDNTHQDGNDWYLPQNYGVGKAKGKNAVNHGGEIWDKLIKVNKNIIMVFSGHILGSGVGQLVSKNNFGENVYQMLANYQKNVKGFEKGNSGYLRIVKVDLEEKLISVKTYSPYLNKFYEHPDHQFKFTNVKF